MFNETKRILPKTVEKEDKELQAGADMLRKATKDAIFKGDI